MLEGEGNFTRSVVPPTPACASLSVPSRWGCACMTSSVELGGKVVLGGPRLLCRSLREGHS